MKISINGVRSFSSHPIFEKDGNFIMKKIQIKTEIIVEVNDAGETITLPIGDANFVKGYMSLIDDLAKLTKESLQITAGTEYEKITEISKKLCGKIDTIIGEGTCRKVFGDVIPVPKMFSEFFDSLAVVFEDYANDRRKMIDSRYSKDRRGSHV